MIDKIFKLNAAINDLNLNLEGRRFKKGFAFLYRELITSTFPKWYVKKFMSFNRLNTPKPYATISGDCDSKGDIEAYPYMINLLDKYDLKACFAVVGKWVEICPEEHKLLAREGHEIINHTYTHPDNPEFNPWMRFNKLDYEKQKEEIVRADDACREILNYKPIGFRTPHFGQLHTPSVYRILEELGYKYSSSTIATRTKNFGIPFMVGEILEFPLSPSPKYPFIWLLPYDIYQAPKGARYHYTEKEFYTLFKELVQLGIENNSYLNFFFDPIDAIKMPYFEKILSILKENFIVVTYRELVERGMFNLSEGDR